MKKRIACLVLALVMLVGILPVSIMPVSALPAELGVSASGVKVIKEFMGFKQNAYEVAKEVYAIGYGTPSKKDAVITEANADIALREALAECEAAVDAFLPSGVKLVQKQRDALVWLVYIRGTGVLTSGMKAVLFDASATRSQIANALCTTQFAGGYPDTKESKAAVEQNMAVANLYVNGVYSSTGTGSFSMTVFDANDGAFAGNVKKMVQVFDTKQTSKIAVGADPVQTGKKFLGWYAGSSEKDFALVTGLSASTAGKTLTARWQDAQDKVAVHYTMAASIIYEASHIPTGDFVIVRKEPADSETQIDIVKREATVSVVSELIDASNYKWLELATGGWVKLGLLSDIPTIVPSVNVAVTDDFVNIREDASVTSKKLGTAKRGEVLTIIMTKDDLWGYCSKGWVYLAYTDFNEKVNVSTNAGASLGGIVATGTVTSGMALKIRQSPNTFSAQLGSLANGTRVEIYEITTTAGHKWGRTEKGWICMDYVAQDSAPVVNTGSTSTGAAISGEVVNTDQVNVRSAAGVRNTLVTTLPVGTKVNVYEQTTVDNASWGRIDQGWVSLNYIKMAGSFAESNSAAAAVNATGTVSSSVNLVIRSGPGTEYAKVSELAPGTKVTVTQRQVVKGVTWGKVSQGWINLSYVTFTSGSQTFGVGGTVVNCNTGVKIRSAAGTTNALVGSIPVGSRVTILERTQVKGIYWGRTDKGWVCMDYIKLDSDWVDPTPAAPNADAAITVDSYSGYPARIKADTALRADASSDSKTLLTLKPAAKVTVTARKLVGEKTFGKVTVGTITGWIDMNDVTLLELNVKVTAAKTNAYEKANTRSTCYAELLQGRTLKIAEDDQTFDGSIVWGKISLTVGGTAHTAWINLGDTTIYPDNTTPTGTRTMTGVGHLTGTITADTAMFKDINGYYYDTAPALKYVLTKDHVVTILARTYVSDTESYGLIQVDSTRGWIDMANVKLDKVEMKVTSDALAACGSVKGASVMNLKKEDKITIIARQLADYANGINDWGQVYINDDATHTYWIILDEGKLSMIGSTPTAAPDNVNVLTGVVVPGSAAVALNVYEEALETSKVIMKQNAGTSVTVLNWKLVNGITWGKVQIGTTVGWVKISDISFAGLTATVNVEELKVYGKADLDSTVTLLKVNRYTSYLNDMVFDGTTLWGNVTVADKTGWINLADVAFNEAGPYSDAIATATVSSVDKNVTVAVTAGGAPGVVSIPKNTAVKLIDVEMQGGKAWWLVDLGSTDKNGWVEMDTLNMNTATAIVNSASVDILDDLVVMNTLSTLYRGEKITVKRFQVYAGSLFGEVDCKDTTGWILICDISGKNVALTPGATNSNPTATTPNTETVTPVTPSAPGTTVPTQAVDAYVVCSSTVNIRSGAGLSYPVVTTLQNGTSIKVHEQVSVGTASWARIDQGWICMDYVKFGAGGGTNGSTGSVTIPTTVPAGAIAVGYANQDLTAYAGTNAAYGKSGSVSKGAGVTIYERKLDGGVSWGRTDSGWVIISYVTITGIGVPGSADMGTIARCGFTANVRGSTNSESALLAKVMVNSRVAVFEKVTVGTETWAHTDLGWINMNYVVMDAESAPLPTVSTNGATEIG